MIDRDVCFSRASERACSHRKLVTESSSSVGGKQEHAMDAPDEEEEELRVGDLRDHVR
jgi:hypothetical protein